MVGRPRRNAYPIKVFDLILSLVRNASGIKAREISLAIAALRGSGPAEKTVTSYIARINDQLEGQRIKGRRGTLGGYTLVQDDHS